MSEARVLEIINMVIVEQSKVRNVALSELRVTMENEKRLENSDYENRLEVAYNETHRINTEWEDTHKPVVKDLQAWYDWYDALDKDIKTQIEGMQDMKDIQEAMQDMSIESPAYGIGQHDQPVFEPPPTECRLQSTDGKIKASALASSVARMHTEALKASEPRLGATMSTSGLGNAMSRMSTSKIETGTIGVHPDDAICTITGRPYRAMLKGLLPGGAGGENAPPPESTAVDVGTQSRLPPT